MLPSTNKNLRTLRTIVGSVINRLCTLDHLRSNRTNLIYEKKKSPNFDLRSRYLLFSRYSKDDCFSSNELELFKVFVQNGWSVFVTSNSALSLKAADQALFVGVQQVNIRRNLGLDLAAHRDSIDEIDLLSKAEEVLIMNNSMIWNALGLNLLIQTKLDKRKNGIWGLTDSNQRHWHIQSYFMLFKGEDAVNDLIAISRDWRNWKFKRTAVQFGEIRCSRFLSTKGMKPEVLFEYNILASLNELDINYKELLLQKVPLNPTQHFWKTLLVNGFPGIKKSLIHDNPARLAEIPGRDVYGPWEIFNDGN